MINNSAIVTLLLYCLSLIRVSMSPVDRREVRRKDYPLILARGP